MAIYVDVLFAINFSMDFLSLFFTAKLLHKRIYKIRMMLAALLGGAYGIFDVLVNLNLVLKAIICVIVPFIMCLIALFERKFLSVLKSFIVFWSISFVLGGIMSALYSVANKIFADYLNDITNETTYNGIRFFVVVSLTIIIMLIIGRIFTKKREISSATVDVFLDGKKFNIIGLCDSGNIVTDPLSGRSVILVSNKNPLGSYIESKDETQKRFIPYEDTTSKGILKGVIPDNLVVNQNNVDAIVAPINKDKFGDYDALIPSSLI